MTHSQTKGFLHGHCSRFKMAAQLLFLDEVLDNEELRTEDGDDDEVSLFSAMGISMRRNLSRSEVFWETVVPLYSVDEFRSYCRMSRGSMEVLCS